MSRRSPRRGQGAFSLVEVALATGIVAFALVAVFGLLSVGINASRDSGDDTRVAFIMQDVAAKVRAEASSVELAADATRMDLTWNAAYNGRLNYTVLGGTDLPADATGQRQPSATGYYTADGQFVKQSTAAAPTGNYYKASVYIRPLDPYPSPMPAPASSAYPFLAVTVKIGWPADPAVNGDVRGAANAARSVATFYLPRP